MHDTRCVLLIHCGFRRDVHVHDTRCVTLTRVTKSHICPLTREYQCPVPCKSCRATKSCATKSCATKSRICGLTCIVPFKTCSLCAPPVIPPDDLLQAAAATPSGTAPTTLCRAVPGE